MTTSRLGLTLRSLGIDTHKEPVVYMRDDCDICKSEGFFAQTRVRVTLNKHSIVATLNTVKSTLLRHNEASLSEYAWNLLSAKEGDRITISHPKPLESLSYIRSKIYGHELKAKEIKRIIVDLIHGELSDINVAMFIAASGDDRLSQKEITDLTRAMVETGQRLSWPSEVVVDKHCIGGLPGNRTTPIVVAIAAAFGLMMPKTSSRAITSPAGTADTMEVFTNVDLSLAAMRRVVEQENGCLVWGGSMGLSPADDLLIRIERTADLDSEGQMVASILSKKIAAGSNRIVIDIPIGTTAKVRSIEGAEGLKRLLTSIAKEFELDVNIILSDGSQPVGRGIGPALEAADVLAVLQSTQSAPQDLRERALLIAGHVLEFSPMVSTGQGIHIARDILYSGKALKKFQDICHAQGGMRDIPIAPFSRVIESSVSGTVINIDNRNISRLAKLAGAPEAKAAGIEVFAPLNAIVAKSQPLFKIHAETRGQLEYALNFFKQGHVIFQIEASS